MPPDPFAPAATRIIKEGTVTDDPDDGWPHGYVVEYCSADGVMFTVEHPDARSWEVVSDRNETTACLVLTDGDDKEMAVYNGTSWMSCRRRPVPAGGAR
jgi:hypothetical protein